MLQCRSRDYLPNTFCHKQWPLSATENEIICKNHIAGVQIQTATIQPKSKRRSQPPNMTCFVPNIKALASVAPTI